MSVSLVKVGEHVCEAEVRGATYIDQAEYCEDDATVKAADGGWYCPVHDPARWDDYDPDEGRDMEMDYWLDDMGD